ncbi:conjugal transfer protein TrbL family protein [Clostridium sp. KNHs216]|uniref:conjugal transfer protein TrbL family protein n=1 Tax=Clostridium sp. KNHs216 TaxID=1550235 RepID=UPI00114EAC21|nr:conjugal transfer protein TrbL family protein [Clostridium sp. KNHs216]TQI68568.1 hypothetical protein LY85_3308 [Clostridium sp. KNHs216]
MFTVGNSMEQLEAWFYYTILNAINSFNQYMGNMGADLFDNQYVQGILYFFQLLGNGLFAVGFVLAILEYFASIEQGKGSLKDTGMNIFKGLGVLLLFTTLPVKLYQLSVNMQAVMGKLMNIAGVMSDPALSEPVSSGSTISNTVNFFLGLIASNPLVNVTGAVGSVLAGITGTEQHVPQITDIFFIIAFAYGFFKILFGNLKRGGILFIQICVCSLYLFSIPRGYLDQFLSWCKQIIGICFTAFLQNLMLMIGLNIFKDQMVIATGVILAASEVPRIAQSFGLDTSMKGNLSSAVHTTTSIINLGRTFIH